MRTRRHLRPYWRWLLLGIWLLPLVFLPLPSVRADASAPLLQFTHALNTEGAFFNGSFLQDREGFFWIGTQSGLLKWDGISLKRYTAGPKSISADYIYTILEDREGLLWLATPNGLNQYDKRTNTFTVYKNDPADPNSISNNVFNWVSRSLAEDVDGNIWVGTTGGLNKYDRTTRSFTRYLHNANNPNSLGSDQVFAVWAAPGGLIWIGTDAGLDRLDPASNTFTHYQNIPDQPNSLSSNSVTALLMDHAGVLWIGTLDGGLNRLDAATGIFTRYRHEAENPNSLASDYVFSITEVNPGELWLTSHIGLGGVDVFNTVSKTFQNYKHDANNPTSLSFDQDVGVYRDRQAIIWVINFNGTLALPAQPQRCTKPGQ
jgi:ligand-binding sensor domain-containing protein